MPLALLNSEALHQRAHTHTVSVPPLALWRGSELPPNILSLVQHIVLQPGASVFVHPTMNIECLEASSKLHPWFVFSGRREQFLAFFGTMW